MKRHSCLFLLLSVFAILSANKASAVPLRVGAVGTAPFVLDNGGKLEGISVDMWQEVAAAANLEYELSPQNELENAMEALKRGELDILLGSFPVNSSLAYDVLLSQPYYHVGLGIAVHRDPPTPWSRIRPFLTAAFFVLILTIIVLLFVAGVLVWLFERNRNPSHFPHDKWHGIASGLWFAAVTMTAVGYGDKTPITLAGRIVASIWMIVAIILFSAVTAAITASVTVSSIPHQTITNVASLHDERVAVLGEDIAQVVASHHGRPLLAQDMDTAFAWLMDRKVSTIVAPKAELLYYVATHPQITADIVDTLFNTQYLSFVLPPNQCRLLSRIDGQILTLLEKGNVNKIATKWTKHNARD